MINKINRMTDNSPKFTIKLFVMKRLFILFFLSTAISLLTFAKQVEESTARKISGNFFASRVDRNQFTTRPVPVLVYMASQKQAEKSDARPAFYIFSFAAPKGFVIVAADDAVSPILAYSLESSFNAKDIPVNLAWWLEGYQMQITDAAAKGLKAAPAIKTEWDVLLSDVSNTSLKSADADDFLVKLYWNQNPHYNDLCPIVNSKKERSPTGCVATAMAMIMKYHNYPLKGTGTHSYMSKYGLLTVDFGNTTYQWNNMPNSLETDSTSAEISAVATLMYHCGVSFDIHYDSSETSGRAAARNNNPNDTCAENALKKYFGYDPNLHSVDRSDYTYENWIKILKDEIDAKRPVFYSGSKYTKKDTSGHSFICDGYNSSNLFHFNWGWGMNRGNGFFKIDTSLYFPDAMDAIIGIQKNPEGVDKKEMAGMLMAYPNPGRGIVEIRLEKGSGKDLQKTTITNMQGRNVYESYAKAENDRMSVDLSAKPQGNYIITLYYKSGEKVSCSLLITK